MFQYSAEVCQIFDWNLVNFLLISVYFTSTADISLIFWNPVYRFPANCYLLYTRDLCNPSSSDQVSQHLEQKDRKRKDWDPCFTIVVWPQNGRHGILSPCADLYICIIMRYLQSIKDQVHLESCVNFWCVWIFHYPSVKINSQTGKRLVFHYVKNSKWTLFSEAPHHLFGHFLKWGIRNPSLYSEPWILFGPGTMESLLFTSIFMTTSDLFSKCLQ